jgi:hypothetical protein
LSATFNLEIQSEHFGNGRSLSIEGSTVETHEILGDNVEKRTRLQFHSHFSNNSRQDAATTTAHMTVLIDALISENAIYKKTTMWDDTDGCGKQYRCAKAYWLLSYLASKYDMTIDRAIGAPSHGKDVVDGINATDKRYLAGCMCLVGTPEANDGDKRMAAQSMVETASKSLADECVRLCSLDSRLQGVKGHMKHAKREASAQLKMRHYHIQDPDDVKYKHIGFAAEKLTTGVLMMECYNIRADPDLGLGVVALRRIPCACQGCLLQLSQPWKVGVPPSEQPRYAEGNHKCERWHIFHGLNDWHILPIHKKKQRHQPWIPLLMLSLRRLRMLSWKESEQ